MSTAHDTSNHDDEEVRIGVPSGRHRDNGPRVELRTDHTPDDFTPSILELRAGETELGRPPQVPSELSLLSSEDRAKLRQLEEEAAARELSEAEQLLVSDPTGLGWLGWFGSPLALTFLVLMVGLAGLFVFNQVTATLNSLVAQPEWLQYLGYAGLMILGSCVLYALLRFTWMYATLRRNRQLRIEGLESLARRTRLRWLASAKNAEAKQLLERYLREFPLDSEKDRRTLLKLGIDDAMQSRLRFVRAELLDLEKFASSDQWFARFRDGFQAELDAAAEGRVKYWASRIWVVTAVAPNALVDSGATLFYSFSLLADLCQVYNLRAGRTGTAVLLGRVFFNAYLAGQSVEWEKFAEEQYDQLFHEAMNVVGVGMGANVAGKFLGKIGAKATTGYLNRILLIRIGRYGIRLLRPVARS